MNTSSISHLADILEESLSQEYTNLNVLDHPLPSSLGIHVNENGPYEVFNFGIMPLSIEFNLNSLKGNTAKKMADLTL